MDVLEELAATAREVARRGVGDDELIAVTLRREYPAEVEDVWEAVTDPKRLARWFAPVSGDLREGGAFQVEGNAEGEIRERVPPSAEIALRVYEELDGTIEQLGWRTQAVTVAYEQYTGRRIPGQRPDGTFQTGVSRSTTLGMAELMESWTEFTARDETVRGMVVGDPRVSGTDRRTTWRTKAEDGSSVVVTSEPEANGTASIVATQIGIPTLEANDEARERWSAVVGRFLESVRHRTPSA